MIACIDWFPSAQIGADSEMERRDNSVFLLRPDGSAVEGIVFTGDAYATMKSGAIFMGTCENCKKLEAALDAALDHVDALEKDLASVRVTLDSLEAAGFPIDEAIDNG